MTEAETQHTALRPLTAQQERVVACLCRGLSNVAIARSIGISVNTVKGHIIAIDNVLTGARDPEVSRRERVRLWGLFRVWEQQHQQRTHAPVPESE